jgi:hypothetical protein
VVDGRQVDEAATLALRDATRARRRERARPVGTLSGTGLEHVAEWEAAASTGATW